jgi:hypothetical protein
MDWYERVRTTTQESTDQKVGGSSPSERATLYAGQDAEPSSSARYSNLSALWPSWAVVRIHVKLDRWTPSRVVPVVCIQTLRETTF